MKYRLSEVMEIIGGGTPKTTKAEYWNGDIPWLSVKDFNNDSRYVCTTEKSITQLGLENSSTKLLNRGDIIISARGTVGEMATIPFPMAFNQSCYGLRARDNIVTPDFLYYLVKYNVEKIKKNSHGSVFDTITRDTFDGIEADIPDLSVQEKISAILSELDEKICLNQKINENLEQQISSVYEEWYENFETDNDNRMVETEYGTVPLGWHYRLLGEMCDSISVTHKFNKRKLIFLNTGDIANGRFLHSDYMSVSDMPGQAKKSIKPNDILYSEIRPINKHFAFVNFSSEDYVVSTKLMVLRPHGIDSRRVYQFLTSNKIIEQLQLEAETRSGTFPQIRYENIKNLPILIADELTEKKFTSFINAVYNQVEQNNLENQKLADLRDALLPKLMSGEIYVEGIEL